MTIETRHEIVLNGARWANNIITELLGNYGPNLPAQARSALMAATSSIHRAIDELQRAAAELAASKK